MENNTEKLTEKLAAQSAFLYDHFGGEIVYDDDRVVKIFVSQPMKNRSDEEIIAERNRLFNDFKNKIHELGYEGYEFKLIDSFFKDIKPDKNVKYSGVWYLGKSFELLATADIAIFANGASNPMGAKGCLLERNACTFYKVPVIEEFDMYNDKLEAIESFKWTVKKALLIK